VVLITLPSVTGAGIVSTYPIVSTGGGEIRVSDRGSDRPDYAVLATLPSTSGAGEECGSLEIGMARRTHSSVKEQSAW
jgi:hypothetical protein